MNKNIDSSPLGSWIFIIAITIFLSLPSKLKTHFSVSSDINLSLMHKILAITLFTVIHFACVQTSQKNSRGVYSKLHHCKINRVKDSVLCGSYAVFENRETQSGRMINLNIIVVPSLHPDSLTTPIFYFEGGPGVAATNNAAFFADTTFPYRKYHDIVLIDVRGTGGSNALNCSSLQIKKGLEQQFEEMYPVEAVKECYDSLSKLADLKQYTTTNVVKDVEEVREWLGYEKISIYGLSYGTRVALTYMKMFPSSIESCILWSPTPTYNRMPLYHALYAQNSLELLFDDCKQDSLCNKFFPDFKKEFNSLMQKGKTDPFTFTYTNSADHSKDLVISWNAFQTKLRTLMYAPAGMRQIPYIIHEAYKGNLKPFVSLYPDGSDTTNFIAEGFYLCVTCAEDVPFIKTKEIDSLTANTFMGTYRIDQQTAACAHWARGNIPDDFFKPVVSNIPTLMFSGGFDPITPTSLAKEIASHLSNCTLVVIPEMSHTFDGLSFPECFDEICVNFINSPIHSKLNLECIKAMQPDQYRVK